MNRVKRAKMGYIACSVLYCLLGAALIAFPGISAQVLCMAAGGISVVCGLAKIAGYFSNDLYNLAFQFDLALGIFVLALGVLLLIHPQGVLAVFPTVIGLFILVDGAFKLQTSLDARRFGLCNWWLILCGALLCTACGLLLVICPFGSAQALMILIGISLLIDGAQNLFNALYTVKIIKRADRATAWSRAEHWKE